MNIMFVDDSTNVLKSLRWIFMDEPYHIFLFDNPLKALSAIKNREFAVIVADQMMSEMEGIEFLEKAKQQSPDTEVMIMSGFGELPAVSNSINRVVITQFIEKPLDINEIKQAVAIALSQYEINVQSRRERMPILQSYSAFSFQNQDFL